MYPSASLCREQEAIQRDRAAKTSLENVRVVAERAALAWGQEAAAAEKREARHLRTSEMRAALKTDKQAGEDVERALSEGLDNSPAAR
jgi:hypothetical protein